MYHFEDMSVGLKIDIGSYHVSKEEIIDFASQFDPASFHLNEAAGNASMLGGLAASGWHVCSMTMRMLCDSYLLNSAGEGSPGLDECKWLLPVLAGDTIEGHLVVEDARLSASRKGIGLVNFRCNVFNQKGEMVMTFTNIGMIRTRQAQ
ncbi:MAG: MaoC family dehydratase [Salaquimonas sp.]